MDGLSSTYLNKLSKYCLKKFIAVIPCDHLSKFDLKIGDQFIVNLGPSSTLGTHFVALNVGETHFSYFDSFGMDCKNPHILNKLKEYKKFVIYSNQQIQDYFSLACGFFSLSYLIAIQQGMSYKEFVALFDSKNFIDNDKICIDLIISHIKSMK